MELPTRMPGLRWGIGLLAVYTAVWIGLEGALWQVLALSAGVWSVGSTALAQRRLGGRRIPLGWWLGGTAVYGALTGLGLIPLTLLFMAVKTGLHAHGPEFTPAEIAWLLAQAPLWSSGGLLAGAALGLFSAGIKGHQP